MNDKNLIWLPIVLGIVLVGGLVAFFVIPKNSLTLIQPNGNVGVSSTILNSNKQPLSANNDRDIQPVPKGSAQTTQTIPPVSNMQKMTSAEVATHNSESSCYISYQKEVYDVTNFIGRHDGGAESILKNCGKNVDDLSAMHPGGNFSSPKVQKAIKSLVIGVLE
jgi:cytochrome b involved in lipid metabolism